MGKWTGVVREIRCIEHLDTRMLFAIKWGNDRAGCAWFATKFERYLRIIEPETQMVLVSCTESCCSTGRDRECFFVEDALNRYTSRTRIVSLQVALIPGDTKGLAWKLDDKKIVSSMRRQAAYMDFHRIIQ